mgnify:CR=1 FL=1
MLRRFTFEKGGGVMDKETKQELDPAIIAKRQDDWLFEEYEDPKTTEAN